MHHLDTQETHSTLRALDSLVSLWEGNGPRSSLVRINDGLEETRISLYWQTERYLDTRVAVSAYLARIAEDPLKRNAIINTTQSIQNDGLYRTHN